MLRVSYPSNENPEKKIWKKKFFEHFSKKNFSGFSLLGQETLDMRVFIYLIGSPNSKDLKKYMWVIFGVPEMGGFGGVDDL